MDQGGLNLIWVLSKRTAGGIKAIYLSFRCKIWMGNVSALFALRRKKRNDVFILCCVCLCGKRGGNSHVALRYLFTPNTQPTNSSTETHNSAAGSPHATMTHNPNLSHPNLFQRNLRFTQIRLICPISISWRKLSNLYKLTIAFAISLDLRLFSICFESSRKTWEFWRKSVKPFFCLSSHRRKRRLFYNLSEKFRI